MSLPTGWRDASAGLPDDVPPSVRPWILLATSMTQALQQAFGIDLHVRVLHDASGPLLADESGLLAASAGSGCVREVALHTDSEVLLAARTVYLPGHSGAHRKLASLGSRPLGELLFAEGEPRWLQRQFVLLDSRAPLFVLVRRVAADTVHSCWARRTVFLFGHQRLVVTEIFLPAMFSRKLIAPIDLSSRGPAQ